MSTSDCTAPAEFSKLLIRIFIHKKIENTGEKIAENFFFARERPSSLKIMDIFNCMEEEKTKVPSEERHLLEKH